MRLRHIHRVVRTDDLLVLASSSMASFPGCLVVVAVVRYERVALSTCVENGQLAPHRSHAVHIVVQVLLHNRCVGALG